MDEVFRSLRTGSRSDLSTDNDLDISYSAVVLHEKSSPIFTPLLLSDNRNYNSQRKLYKNVE